jgi:hypothetical protein
MEIETRSFQISDTSLNRRALVPSGSAARLQERLDSGPHARHDHEGRDHERLRPWRCGTGAPRLVAPLASAAGTACCSLGEQRILRA